MLAHRHATLLLLVFFGVLSVIAQDNSNRRIYSNVEYNEAGSDLLGTELELTLQGQQVDGRLKIYQGGCAPAIPVVGKLSDGQVLLSAQNDAYGKIEIRGTLRATVLHGTLTLERAKSVQKTKLKRIAKPHC